MSRLIIVINMIQNLLKKKRFYDLFLLEMRKRVRKILLKCSARSLG